MNSYQKALKSKPTERMTGYQWKKKKQRILKRDKRKCVNCGSGQDLEVDHEVPLALGGSNKDSNLRTYCKNCHKKKTRHDITKLRRIKIARFYEIR